MNESGIPDEQYRVVADELTKVNRVIVPAAVPAGSDVRVAILPLEQDPIGGIGLVPLQHPNLAAAATTTTSTITKTAPTPAATAVVVKLLPAPGTNQTESTKCYAAAEYGCWIYAFAAKTSTLYAHPYVMLATTVE